MVCTLIVGRGDMALGLCRQYGLHNSSHNDEEAVALKGHHSLLLAIRDRDDIYGTAFADTGVVGVELNEGIDRADVIVLAIPSHAFKSFLLRHLDALKSKILVDISNPSKPGQNVPSALDEIYRSHGHDYEVNWVKAFNNVGALDLITRKATANKPLSTIMCGNNAEAVDAVKTFALEGLAFDKVTVLPRSSFVEEMEESQTSLGWEWIHTFWIMLFIHAASFAYIAVRLHKGFGVPKDNMPTYTMSRAFGSTALTGFAFTQVPGIIANGLRSFGGRGARFPHWLQWSLAIRKHMGLASFFALAAHAILTCLILSPVYHARYFNPLSNRLLLYPELSFLFGVLGFCCYTVCAIASLPSVGAAMNYKQWDFVFGKFIWLALAMGTLHPVLLGVKAWKLQSSRPLGMPSPTLMSSLIPLTVMAAKIVQVGICAVQRALVNARRPNQGMTSGKSARQHHHGGSSHTTLSQSDH